MPPRDHDDAEHDAWLREALRHAPDASAQPPVALREAILAEARASTASTQAARAKAGSAATMHPLLAFWHWLARPPVAAGFASVMAATLVGMMWWGRPMDEAMPRTAPLQRAEPAPPATAPQAESSTGAVAVAAAPKETIPATLAQRRDNVAKVAPRRESAATVDRAVADKPLPFSGTRETAVNAAAEAKRSEPGVADSPVDALKKDSAETAPPALAFTPAEPATVSPAAAPAPMPQRLARSRAGEARKDEKAATESQPLAPLLAALDTEQKGALGATADRRQAPPDDALRRWLRELDTATAGRWRPVHEPEPEAANPTTPLGAAGNAAPPPRIAIRDAGSVRIDGSTVRLDVTEGGTTRHWQATLAPGSAARLQATRPRARP